MEISSLGSPSYQPPRVHSILLLLLPGPGHIQPSTYVQQRCNLSFASTNSAALRAVCALVKMIHEHMHVHRQGSLIGIRKTQHDLHKTQAILL